MLTDFVRTWHYVIAEQLRGDPRLLRHGPRCRHDVVRLTSVDCIRSAKRVRRVAGLIIAPELAPAAAQGHDAAATRACIDAWYALQRSGSFGEALAAALSGGAGVSGGGKLATAPLGKFADYIFKPGS